MRLLICHPYNRSLDRSIIGRRKDGILTIAFITKTLRRDIFCRTNGPWEYRGVGLKLRTSFHFVRPSVCFFVWAPPLNFWLKWHLSSCAYIFSINLSKMFLIYKNLSTLVFKICMGKPHKNRERQFDDGSCFHSAQKSVEKKLTAKKKRFNLVTGQNAPIFYRNDPTFFSRMRRVDNIIH
jgi:hypothetical protein